jgi:hypothetical protein
VSGLPGAVRPTVRCVREDLDYPKLPPATLPLDRLDAPVLRKAQEVCRTSPPATGRIVSIDDRVLWKVKIERWRGAVWCELPRRWLVAAGRREAGSPDDFYADLADKGRRWRAEHNRAAAPPVTTDTLVNRLLPAADDEDRIALEQAAAAVDEIRTVVADLVLSSARTSAEQPDEAGGCAIAVLVRRTEHEVYVGIRISGTRPRERHRGDPGRRPRRRRPSRMVPGRHARPVSHSRRTCLVQPARPRCAGPPHRQIHYRLNAL